MTPTLQRRHRRHDCGMAFRSGPVLERAMRNALPVFFWLVAVLFPACASAGEARIAVAANFAEAMDDLEPAFESATGHDLIVSTGSTGQIYAQIVNGAPYDIFLAADEERPALLEEQGTAVAGSRFTYAVGRLTLWSAGSQGIGEDGAATLSRGDFRHLAIANPDLAPYGAAALETLAALGLREALKGKIVMGQNVGQAHALVSTGNAELGFVALSSVLALPSGSEGSRWDVPDELYAPIRQDAVLLTRAADNAAARAFLDWLQSDEARAIIAAHGYGLD